MPAAAPRIATLQALLASINTTFPAAMASPPTIGAGTASPTISPGTDHYFATTPMTAITPHPVNSEVTLAGGLLTGSAGSFKNMAGLFNGYPLATTAAGQGNPGPRLRFTTNASRIEVMVSTTTNPTIELRVNGEVGGTFGSGASDKYFPIDFGSTATRNIELIDTQGERFACLTRVPTGSTLSAWPADLRVFATGDSFMEAQLGRYISDTIGQADTWNMGGGSTGFVAKIDGSRNTVGERLSFMLSQGVLPDVVIDASGINDGNYTPGSYTTADQFADIVDTTFLAPLIAANPAVVIFMTGPMTPNGSGNTTGTNPTIRDGKQIAAVRYPQNCTFIDNLAEGWVTGSGYVGHEQGDGNADWITGADGVHPTTAGSQYLAQRIAGGMATRAAAIVAAAPFTITPPATGNWTVTTPSGAVWSVTPAASGSWF